MSARRGAAADAGGVLAAAEAALTRGQVEAARAAITSAWADPATRPPLAHRLLAIGALMAGDTARALDAARRLVAAEPAGAFGWMLLGRAHKAGAALADAAAAYRHALTLDERLAEAHVSLGIVLRLQGDIDGAIACHRAALRWQPGLAAAHTNLGVALAAHIGARGGDPIGDEALAALRAAVEIAPRDGSARRNLAAALAQRGELVDAAEQLNRALGAEPQRLDLCLMLHAVLVRAGLQQAAREVCERWLGLHPLDVAGVEVAARLATTLLALDDADTALAWIDRCLPLAPNMPELRHSQAHALQQRLDVPGALAALAHANRAAPHYLPAWQTRAMTLNYIAEDQAEISQLHREVAAACAPAGAAAVAPPRALRSSRRSLRVGLVSGDLRRHSVAYFIEPLLRAHDRRRLELHAFDTAVRGDDVSTRLRGLAAGWHPVAQLGDDALAAAVRAAGIDVLVDLAGHTADSRLELFARRPVPLSLAYLGYPTTTGLAAIDGRISDPVIDPPDEAGLGHNAETVLHLPPGMFCFRPEGGDDRSAPAGPAAARGESEIVFGSFNNLAKVSASTLALWARVLHAVPRSRLLMKARALSSPAVRARLADAFGAHGIEPARIGLDRWRNDLASHLAVYGEVDIALDTFPYNGATTTCEALWAGVPVVSLSGATHVSRMGRSILRSAGLEAELACADGDAFVACAARLAADHDARATLRRGLRDRLLASALFDELGFARHWADVVERAWDERTR